MAISYYQLMEKLLGKSQTYWFIYKEKNLGDEMVLSVNEKWEILELTMVLEERPQ